MIRVERSTEIPKKDQKIPSNFLFDEIGFRHKSAEAAAEAFADKNSFVYGRIAHPNTEALAQIYKQLEKGEDALILASGMAATTTVVLSLCQSDDCIISSSRIYGGTYTLFRDFLPGKNNINTKFVTEPQYLLSWQEAIESSSKLPKLLFLETPGNPSASTTHSGMSEKDRLEAGVTNGLIRISVEANKNFKKTTLKRFMQALDIFEQDS